MAGLTEERFIAKRIGRLFYLAAITLLQGVSLGVCHKLPFSDTLAAVFVDILFLVMFIYYLESERLHRKKRPDSSEDYQRLAFLLTAGVGITLLFSYLPDYTVPMLAGSFLLTSALQRELALVTALFFDVQLAMACGYSADMLICYVVLTLLGSMLVSMYGKKEHRVYAEAMAFALTVSVPALFAYMEWGRMSVWLLLFTAAGGVFGVASIHFLYDRLHFQLARKADISLDTIVDKSYHLVKEIKKYSQVDYNHALRVSRIAAHCAAHIKADVKVAAVGGFYYRLGKLGGEPFIENGVRIAQNNCFPQEIITILSEYNGELAPLSTVESAIVHMTDTLVTKFELLDQSTLSSSWNRDMVIYQTLNDKSAAGIFDESGLTMNQFLKIREFLAKEEELL